MYQMKLKKGIIPTVQRKIILILKLSFLTLDDNTYKTLSGEILIYW